MLDRPELQLWVPPGFAHGFYTLTDEAHLIYKVNNFWNKDSERTIIWNDPNLSINWVQLEYEPILSVPLQTRAILSCQPWRPTVFPNSFKKNTKIYGQFFIQ